ncbi:unnamed protein product [Anisakis simplex]|uniref:Uncharacterized protein n=1 Tax=Anisakis simplex TaxID=6269 RepID=A0A3P6S1V7_ANISI|nr:unnamed protein product [Anisakis simplex]
MNTGAHHIVDQKALILIGSVNIHHDDAVINFNSKALSSASKAIRFNEESLYFESLTVCEVLYLGLIGLNEARFQIFKALKLTHRFSPSPISSVQQSACRPSYDTYLTMRFIHYALTSPGVRYRLTFEALTRTTKVFISAFIPELSKLSIPFKIQNLTVDKESLAIRSIRLVNINEPRDVSIEPYQPNAMLVKIKNFALSMECDLNGVMNDKLLDGRLHLHSNRTSMNLLIRIRKHPTALAPIIDLRECHTYTDNDYTSNNSSNRLKLTTEFMPSNSNSVVEPVISENAENFFDSVLCTYIDWIIDRKINKRFVRTSTSVSLAKLAQIDPKHSALAALSRRYHKAHHRKG